MTEKEITGNTLHLSDGRLLGYAEYGNPDGKPTFFFHGWLGSRLQAMPADNIASRLGLRIIAPERPGYGLSDFKPGRSLIDWSNDMSELANSLKIDRFSVIGVSGGGPYVLACAYRIPRRVTKAFIVCSVGPYAELRTVDGLMNRIRMKILKTSWLLRFHLWLLQRNPNFLISLMPLLLSKPDKNLLSRSEIKQVLMKDINETFHSGIKGAVLEGMLYARPWRFRLEDISTEVHLWHGDEDTVVPPSTGRYLAKVIPNCQATFCSGEGHYSLIYNKMEEILYKVFNNQDIPRL